MTRFGPNRSASDAAHEAARAAREQIGRDDEAGMTDVEAAAREHHRQERDERQRRHRAQHHDRVEQPERLRIRLERREPAALRVVRGRQRRKSAQHDRESEQAGEHQPHRGRFAVERAHRAERQRRQREADRAAADEDRHREAGPRGAETVRHHRARRMEHRGAEAAHDQHRRQPRRRRRHADQAEHHDGDDRPGDQQSARMPAIREPAESELRDRRRELEDHRERARREQRQPELRNQQRQQRRVDVRVAVDDQMRGRHAHDARREDRLRSCRVTRARSTAAAVAARSGWSRGGPVTLNQIP